MTPENRDRLAEILAAARRDARQVAGLGPALVPAGTPDAPPLPHPG